MASYENQFMWYELSTEDVHGAQAFYCEVIGWGAQPWEGGNHPYIMWTVNGDPIGGLMALPEQAKQMGAPPHWKAYVGVRDADAATAKAKGLGASILLPPTDIAEVGRFSIIADPQGGVIALYKPAQDETVYHGQAQPGRVIWHELVAPEQDAAWDFYHQLFGWEQGERVDAGEQGRYQMFTVGGRTVGGMMSKPPGTPGAAMWLYYITVDHLPAALERVRSHGGQILSGPMEVPGGDQVAQCKDPQGAIFALHALGQPK